jgi:hypothetical protein
VKKAAKELEFKGFSNKEIKIGSNKKDTSNIEAKLEPKNTKIAEDLAKE